MLNEINVGNEVGIVYGVEYGILFGNELRIYKLKIYVGVEVSRFVGKEERIEDFGFPFLNMK